MPTRQGDPISPYLFVLCVEILAIMIRKNTKIKGINIDGIEYKITQFADDTQFLQNGDKASFLETVKILERFGMYSGLKMNCEKTSVTWIGSRT